MKKIITLLLAISLVATFGTSVMAADETVTGFYDIGTATNVEIVPYAGSTQVTVAEKNIDDDSDVEAIYENADRLEVTFNGATENEHYGVILIVGSGIPTADNTIFYIDQVSATSSSITFDVYPMLPTETTDLTLYISSSKDDFDLISIPLNYAVDAAVVVEPEYRLGDTNGDGEVTVKDVIPIRRYITGGYTVTMDERAADVNGDGSITVKDVIPIRRYITGGYGVEL